MAPFSVYLQSGRLVGHLVRLPVVLDVVRLDFVQPYAEDVDYEVARVRASRHEVEVRPLVREGC